MENKFYMTFNEEGFLTGTWNSNVYDENKQRLRPVYGPVPEPTEDNPTPEAPIIGEEPNPDSPVPVEAVEITKEQADELFSYQGLRKFIDGEVVVYTPLPQPAPVPAEVSDRQFFQHLAISGLITEEEAYTYMQVGQLPPAFVAMIDQLPTNQRFDAKMKLMANTFRRDNPYVGVFAAMKGMRSEQVDDLWRAAATLVMGLCSSSPSVPKSRHQDHASVRGQHQGRHIMP
jgi:hypothetical protein